MLEILNSCNLCPHMCNVNRIQNKIGRCKCGSSVRIALASLHFFEEPCISGTNGSGTVFFSNCNLSCIFCQNYKISQLRKWQRNFYRKFSRYIFRTAKKRCS